MSKDPKRVSLMYKPGTKEWEAQYNMLLDDGVTCEECIHCADSGSCCGIFGGSKTNTKCQFYPSCFVAKKSKNE